MSEVSKEYGAAFFMLACEKHAKQEYAEALDVFCAAFKEEPEYFEFLASPAISLKERQDSIVKTFSMHVPEDAVSFLQLLCRKGRLSLFFNAVKEYKDLYLASERVMHIEVTSVVALTEDEKKMLKEKLEKKYSCTAEMQYLVDESLLGGMVVRFDDKVLDASVKSQLRKMKDVMSE